MSALRLGRNPDGTRTIVILEPAVTTYLGGAALRLAAYRSTSDGVSHQSRPRFVAVMRPAAIAWRTVAGSMPRVAAASGTVTGHAPVLDETIDPDEPTCVRCGAAVDFDGRWFHAGGDLQPDELDRDPELLRDPPLRLLRMAFALGNVRHLRVAVLHEEYDRLTAAEWVLDWTRLGCHVQTILRVRSIVKGLFSIRWGGGPASSGAFGTTVRDPAADRRCSLRPIP